LFFQFKIMWLQGWVKPGFDHPFFSVVFAERENGGDGHVPLLLYRKQELATLEGLGNVRDPLVVVPAFGVSEQVRDRDPIGLEVLIAGLDWLMTRASSRGSCTEFAAQTALAAMFDFLTMGPGSTNCLSAMNYLRG
jgi:hypothetical protein